MSSATKFVRDRYKRLLPKQDVKLPPSFKHFYLKLVPSFSMDILRYLGTFKDQRILIDFVDALYRIVVSAIDFENHLAVERSARDFCRPQRRKFELSRIHVEHSLRHINLARNALGSAAKEIDPSVLRFNEISKSLEQLHHDLAQLESDCAYIVPKSLRTDREEVLSLQSKFRLKHALSKPKRSAEFRYSVTERVEHVVRKYTGTKVPSNHVDKFISTFFDAGFAEHVTEENVKTLRVRIKQRKRKKTAAPDTAASNLASALN